MILNRCYYLVSNKAVPTELSRTDLRFFAFITPGAPKIIFSVKLLVKRRFKTFSFALLLRRFLTFLFFCVIVTGEDPQTVTVAFR